MNVSAFLESLIANKCGDNTPDATHNIRDLGSVVSGTKAYKCVADFDYIYINEVPVISTFNDYHTAGDVFISMMAAMGAEYEPPAGWR